MANPTLCSFVFLILFFINSSYAQAALNLFTGHEFPSEKSKCYDDIDSGEWGEQCRASLMDRENCAIKCLSPACYELIYQSDPLEEGEIDHYRSQEYSYCMRRVRAHGDNAAVHNSGGFYTITPQVISRIEEEFKRNFRSTIYATITGDYFAEEL